MWLAENTKLNPDNVGAALDRLPAPLRLDRACVHVGAHGEGGARAADNGDQRAELDTKLALAKFFYRRLLPQAGAHLANLTSGAEPLMALSAEAF